MTENKDFGIYQHASYVTLHSKKWLTLKEHICMILNIEFQFTHIMLHCNLVSRWGGGLFIPMHILALVFISFPYFITYTTMGAFTRKSFIRFWDIFPIFRGISYSIILNILFNCTMNSAYAGLSMLLLINNLRLKVNSGTCKFPGASDLCVPMYNLENYTKKCCEVKPCRVEFHFSSWEYYKTFSYADPELSEVIWDENRKFQWDWFLVMTGVWLLIYVFVLIDLKRYKLFIVYNTTFYGIICLCIVIGTLIAAQNYRSPDSYASELQDLWHPEFYVQLLVHASYYSRPGEYSYFGSISNVTNDPFLLALALYLILAITFNIFAIWMSIGTQIIQHTYNVHDQKCLHVNGKGLMFAIIPDIINRSYFPQLGFLIYYTLIAVWSMQSCVVATSASYHTIVQTYRKLKRFKAFILGLLCLIPFTLAVFFTNKHYQIYFQGWRESGYWFISVLYTVTTAIAMCMYSVQKLINDYVFLYGKSLHQYWKIGFKISYCIAFAVFGLSFTIFQEVVQIQIKKGRNVVVITIVMIFTMSPLVFGICYSILEYVVKKISPFSPMENWGPPENEALKLRQEFNPQRKTRYNHGRIACKHHCLLFSKKLDYEIKFMEKKKDQLFDVFIERKKIELAIKLREKLQKEKDPSQTRFIQQEEVDQQSALSSVSELENEILDIMSNSLQITPVFDSKKGSTERTRRATKRKGKSPSQSVESVPWYKKKKPE